MNKSLHPFYVYVISAIGGVVGGYILLVLLMILRIFPEEMPPQIEIITITYVISWLIPFALIRWWLVRARVGSKKLGSAILTAILVIVLIGFLLYMVNSPYRIIGPTKIIGGAPSKYQDGQIVWAVKKAFLGREIKKGDVVLFNQPVTSAEVSLMGDSVGEVVGLPNDMVNTTIYDFHNNVVPSEIPAGYYLIEKNKSGIYRILRQNMVTDVVILP